MPEPNESEESATVQATQGSTGRARRASDSVSFSPTPEPTDAELDARQDRLASSRRSGPPLPETPAAPEVSFGLGTDDQPTEVDEKDA